jgi:hypothetical protein
MPEKFHKDFRSFWYFYLSQHMRTGTRAVHYVGTTVIWIATATAVADHFLDFLGLGAARWWLIPGALVYMYVTAFISHWTIEKNQPATFVYPWYSIFGDLYMYWRMTNRGITQDVQVVRERLANGWAIDRYGFYPPDEARARGVVHDAKMVSAAAGAS